MSSSEQTEPSQEEPPASDAVEKESQVVEAKSLAPALPFVVGIGASAGGLDALTRFVENAPEKTKMAFVVVQHLSPNHESLMVDLLSSHTHLSVVRAEDGATLEAETVYVIEPGMDLRVEGHVLLSRHTDTRVHRPIDVLFHSMAEAYGSECAAVVLSGTGSDGTQGMQAVLKVGGTCIAQEPETAGFDGMPRAAIEGAGVNLILPPENMIHALVDFRTLGSGLDEPAQDAPEDDISQSALLLRILQIVRTATGLDFSYYKESTLIRRIRKRMQQNGVGSYSSYAAHLAVQRSEVIQLADDLLIGVTQFFRDPDTFEIFRTVVLPRLIARPGGDPLRVWVAGCSTGEEAYSVAMVISDALAKVQSKRGLRLFATDVDERAVQIAGRGEFAEKSLHPVPPELRARYFAARSGGFSIQKDLREQLLFSSHNVITDPPFSRLDLVVCRNLLIYLKPTIQDRVIQVLTNGLRSDGVLWLGPSETLGASRADYEDIDTRAGFYSVKSPRRRSPVLPVLSRKTRTLRGPRETAPETPSPPTPILRNYLPTTIIADSDLRVLFRFGRSARFVTLPEGRASLDVRDLLPKRLGAIVSTAAQKAISQQHEIYYREIPVQVEDEALMVNIRALGFTEKGEKRVGIIFESVAIEEAEQKVDPTSSIESDAQSRVEILEDELRHTSETLQATVEELESSNEELQATNEELVASNEELQSVNEELHSVNEELHTVNLEYGEKLEQLGAFNDELDVLLSNVEAGVLFLDERLYVRRFNARAAEYIHLLEQDSGRPLAHLTHRLVYASLLDDCANVLRDGSPIRRTVETEGGHQVKVDVRPILSAKAPSRGVVLSFIDLSATTAELERLRALVSYLDQKQIPALVLNGDLRIESGNETLWRALGRDPNWTTDLSLNELADPGSQEELRRLKATLAEGRPHRGKISVVTPGHRLLDLSYESIPQGQEGSGFYHLLSLGVGSAP